MPKYEVFLWARQKLLSREVSNFASTYIGLIILVSTFAVYLVTLNAVWATDHTTAFVEFDYAVWANHSFVLGSVGSFNPGSVDVFAYYESFYMANAPGAAFIALPFAILGFVLTGHFTMWGDVLLLTEVPVALANALAAYFVYKIGSLFFKKRISAFLAFCYGFSTISWPFATFLYQSDFSALFDLIAVYFAIRISRAGNADKTSLALFCGLAVATGIMVDYVNAILVPLIGAYIFLSRNGSGILKERITSLAAFLGESVGLTFFLLATYNYASFGKVFVSSEELYLDGSSLFGSFTYPVYKGIILNLFTPMRGLFFFSPILLLGVLGYWKMLRKSGNRQEGILFLAVFSGIFLLYSSWYSVTGGLSFGPRFLVGSIPFLLLPAGFAISGASRNRSVIIFVLYAAGVIENGLASVVGVLTPPGNWLSSPFITNIFPDILTGQSDSWWRPALGSAWIIAVALIVSFALVFPLICVNGLRKPETPVAVPP